MHINVKRSKEFIMKEIKQILIEISEIKKQNYKDELVVYHGFAEFNSYKLAESQTINTTLFGHVIHKDKDYKDLLIISLNEFELEIFVIDPKLSEIATEKFSEFANLYKNNIFIISIIKDF